jgi:hypothetical protein
MRRARKNAAAGEESAARQGEGEGGTHAPTRSTASRSPPLPRRPTSPVRTCGTIARQSCLHVPADRSRMRRRGCSLLCVTVAHSAQSPPAQARAHMQARTHAHHDQLCTPLSPGHPAPWCIRACRASRHSGAGLSHAFPRSARLRSAHGDTVSQSGDRPHSVAHGSEKANKLPSSALDARVAGANGSPKGSVAHVRQRSTGRHTGIQHRQHRRHGGSTTKRPARRPRL